MAKFVGGLVAGIVGTTLLFVIVVGVPKSPQLGPASMRPMRPPAAVPSAECLTTGQRYRVVPGRPLRLIPTDERGPADVYSPGGQSEETVGKPAWFYVVFSDTEPSVTVDAEDVAALP